jgi:putative transcriptional regulator
MVEHEDGGALGVILNRPGDKRIDEIWEKTGHKPCDNRQPIYIGGPVPGPLMAVHTLSDLSEKQILPGVYFATHRDYLDQLVRQDRPFRLFVGHSGWGSGQLESEMNQGGWLTSPATASDVFSDPETIWKTITGRIGLKIIAPRLKPDQIPGDVHLN